MKNLVTFKLARLLFELNLTSLVSDNYEYGYTQDETLVSSISDITYPAIHIFDALLLLKNEGLWLNVDFFIDGTLWTPEISKIGPVDENNDLEYVLSYNDERNKSFYDPVHAYLWGLEWSFEYVKNKKTSNN